MNTPADRLPGADAEDTVPESDGLAAEVPAGGAGADSGAVSAAEIDADDEARVQNVSSQNDLPGVGTRSADGGMDRGTDDTSDGDGDGAPSPRHEDGGGEPHVDDDSPIARFQPGVGRDSAASSRIAQNLPDPDA